MGKRGRPKGLSAKTLGRDDRLCLRCGKPFKSDGPGNRLCWVCNHLNQALRELRTYRVTPE